MKLLGFNFTKISVERFLDTSENLKINTNVDIGEIKKIKEDIFKGKEDFMGVKFTFTVDYDPNIAKIELKGTILLSVDPKTAKDVLKQWEEKKIPEKFKLVVFNTILRKANIKALQLEEDMGLPLHITLPHVKAEDKK
ncbi:hypothetical protein BMS3Abin17_01034 [archaeon BMS3Abin17]|nr:hypothetical protein BMS3Abin17_01034 [archaeon BMS3Abin17]HDZ60313.1 hypothetical protein [Candidatus Pacearchaeota archaeon]